MLLTSTPAFFVLLTTVIEMFCVKAPRELSNKKSQHSALAASDCWGNVSVLVGTTARACRFSSDTTL